MYGYFEVESIDSPRQIVVAVNPKEYYEHFENIDYNKKHKRQRKGTAGMNFENFAARIADSNQIDSFETPANEYEEQQRFTVIDGKMQKTTVMKTKFSQTNDKRYYYLNGITSYLGHTYLNDFTLYKEKKEKKLRNILYKKKTT